MDRVLIIKLSSLGDVIHALPVASALRRRFPAARISWVVEDWIAPLLAAHPAIDRVVVFPRLAWRAVSPSWATGVRCAVRLLRDEPYDFALDLQGLLKSAVISLLSRAPVRFGRSRQREGAALVSRATPPPPERTHAVDEYLHCAAVLGASRTPVEFGLRPQTAATESVTRLLFEHGVPRDAPLVSINPSASAAWKGWPIERWVTLAAALAEVATVVIVGSAVHRDDHADVARAARTVDLTAETTLPELGAEDCRITTEDALLAPR